MPHSSLLYQAFFEHPDGLCGQHDPALPLRVIQPLEKRLHLIALGSIFTPNSNSKRWGELIKLQDHWLLDASQVAYKTSHQVHQALSEENIRSPQHIARVWWQICRGIQGRFDGSFRALLEANGDNALDIQSYLRQSRITFPVLSAPITSARWLDLNHRIGQIQLKNWDKLRVTIPSKQKEAALLFRLDESTMLMITSISLFFIKSLVISSSLV